MLKRFFVLVLVLAVAAGAAAWWAYQRIQTPYRGFAEPEVFVELPQGTGVAAIAARLAAAGVVPDAISFRIAARLSGDERRLKAGEYRFDAPASPAEIVGRLARGDVFVRAITFPEGHTIAEMAVMFEKSGIGSRAEFERAARDGSAIGEFDPGAENLEGYLFPDTYALPRGAGAEGAVAAMVSRFKAAFDSELREAAMAEHWSVRDIVTLASLVEKETAAAEERPLVSAVYRNRLKIGMPLQCDPTVIYALMKMRRWNGNLTRADLGLNSPYNTYRFPGLPPGPIASPGRASLEAAVRPANVPYLYFVSRNDGTHAFATTLAEHNRNVAEWQVNYFRRKR
jgi:UPF0755 protein